MAVAPDAKRRERLIDGRYMTCPRCREKQDILRFIPMGIIEEFQDETNPIYKCPECRWVFSPALTLSEFRALVETFESREERQSD
jgi:uncharacterized Zn finger protein